MAGPVLMLVQLISLLLMCGSAMFPPWPSLLTPRIQDSGAPATTAPTTTAPAADPADEFLVRLERSTEDLRAFTATIAYYKVDTMLDRRELRTGRIIYEIDAHDDAKRFAVLFDRAIINNRQTRRLEHFVFDGRWLAEIDHEQKQFIKREIVAPGEQLDPLKLGEGPIPLPIGQPRDEVLGRFDVKLLPPPTGHDETVLSSLENVQGLELTPKPGTPEAEDFDRVEIYYDNATLLPRGIFAEETNGDLKIVRLNQLVRNPELDAETQALLSVEDPDPRAWRIDIRPWAGD